MTKTLTEQWKSGKLPEDCYYILTKNGHIKKERTCFYSHTDEQCFCFTSNNDIEEVIAPVPSYEEYCNLVFQVNKPKNPLSDVMMCYDTEREKEVVEPLQKKLAIATKALKDYANSDEWELVDSKNVYWSRKRFPYPWRIAGKALKEMEGVK